MQIALGGGCVEEIGNEVGDDNLFWVCLHQVLPNRTKIQAKGFETHKTTFGVGTKALGWIDDIQIKIGIIVYNMIFVVVDTNSYNLVWFFDENKTSIRCGKGSNSGFQ